MNIKQTTLELTHPVGAAVLQFCRDTRSFVRNLPELLQDAWDRHQVEKMRKRYINDRMEALTDHTLLDRIAAGEKHA